MPNITTCTGCGQCYEESSEERANESTRLCPDCHTASNGLRGFQCGPRETCPDGTRHEYTEWEEIPGGGTAKCAKCGHRAIDDAWWY